MFWNRKRKKRDPSTSDTARVDLYDPLVLMVHLESPLDHEYQGILDGTCVVQLDSPFTRPVRGRLEDLCIQGTTIRVSAHDLPPLEPGTLVGVRIEHATQGWSVRTPGHVCSIERESEDIRLGLEFVNAGNLYAQLDSRLGAYFDRRRTQRALLERDALDVQMRSGPLRLRAVPVDISLAGMGAVVPIVEAATLQAGAELEVRVRLPDGELQGSGKLVRKERLKDQPYDLIGVAFDQGSWSAKDRTRLEQLVRETLGKRLRWVG